MFEKVLERIKSWQKYFPNVKWLFVILTILGITTVVIATVFCVVMWEKSRNLSDLRRPTKIDDLLQKWETRSHMEEEIDLINGQNRNVCLNISCNRTANEFLADMNEKVNPCDDFYSFVCGNFIKNAQIPSGPLRISRLEMIEMAAIEKFHEFMTKDNETDELNAFKKMKNFYKACINTPVVEENGLKTLKKYIEEFGGWPVVAGDEWKEDNFSWMRLSYNLRKRGFPFDVFVKFQAKSFSLLQNGPRILTVSPGDPIISYSELKNRDVLRNTTLFRMKRIAELMGAVTPENELQEILDFDRKIFESVVGNDRKEMLAMTSDISVMKKKYPEIPWIIFESEKRDNIHIENSEFLDHLENLLKSTSKRVQANYIIWRLLVDKSAELLIEMPLNNQSKKEKCFQIISEKMHMSFDALHVKKYLTPEAKSKLDKLIADVKFQISQKFKKLQSDEISVLSYPLDLFDGKKIEEYYSDLIIDDDNFINSYLNCNLHNANRQFDQKKLPGAVGGYWDWAMYEKSGNKLKFNKKLRAIELPVSMLQSSVFDSYHPDYVNYGGLGAQMSLLLSRAMLEEGKTPLPAYTTVNYQGKCYRYNKYRVKNEENFRAMQIAMDATSAAVREFSKDFTVNDKLLHFPYDFSQAFWVSSMHSQCVKHKKPILDLHSEVHQDFTLYFLNIPNFLEDFKCVNKTKRKDC